MMNPHEDTLNIGATLPRTPTGSSPEGPSAELELLHTIKMPGTGTLVFNRYRLQKVLGRGGMGVVWLAEDTKLDRLVALKFLPDVIGADPVALKELKDETRRGLDLAHPNIVRIYDFVDDEEAAAISMEYVNGKSLSEMRLGQPHHVFSVDALAPWLGQMCDALDYAHLQRRIVHRDLKPANLMVNTESQVKITDFGIARSVSDTMSRLSMLRANTSGTLLYMSPQQAMGDRPKPTDDIYSVGATLYELLSGKPPFYSGDISMQITAKNAPSVRQRREELEIQSADDIPRDWEDTIASCLDKDPAKRPQSAGDLARRLGLSVRTDSAISGVKVRSDGPRSIEVRTDRGMPDRGTPVSLAAKKRSSGWIPLTATLVLALGVGTAGGAWWWMHRPAQVMLQSDPPGAVVAIGGQTQMTPAVFAHLKPGHYSARVNVEGYEGRTIEVDVGPGERVSPAVVKLERHMGDLLLSSDPDGVPYEIKLANDENAPKLHGETPKTLRLPVGLYEVTMRHEGELKTIDVEVGRNAEQQQSFKFIKASPVAPLPVLASSAPPQPPPLSEPPSLSPPPMAAGTQAHPTAASQAPAVTPPPVAAANLPSPSAPVPPAPAASETGSAHGSGLTTASGSLMPQAPGASVTSPGAPAVPNPSLPPLAAPNVAGTQTAVSPPPSGYWKLDEIFNGSSFNSYSRNGKAYLLFEVQAALKEKSHYNKPVDGQVGTGTHKAIVSFQSASGLQPTGQLDAPTIAALGIGSIEDKSDWSAPQRKRTYRSNGGGGNDDGDDSGWWKINVADPFKRAFRR